MSNDQVQPGPGKPRPSRARRLLRLMVGTVLTLCLVAVAGFWVITRSWFIISQLKPQLERRLGGEVVIGEAAYQGDGRVVFTNLTLRARSIPGEAGQIASIGRAVVKVDLRKLFSGGLSVEDVEVEDALLRLSEDSRQGGQLNVMALEPVWPAGTGKGKPTPPRVRITRAALEFGSHGGGPYEMLGRRLVSGEMYPAASGDGWYNFELGEVDEDGRSIGREGVFIKGEWNPATNEQHSRIDGIELDERVYWMCPHKARLMWDRMDLKGKVDGVIVHWYPDQPFLTEFKVKDVALTLPIETENLWARYHEGKVEPTASRPRMHVKSGTIRLGSDAVELQNLVGELGSSDERAALAGVPYNISFSMSSFPPIDWENREQWMEQVLTSAPFELKFAINEFALTRNQKGEVPALDLPVLVAKALAKFQMTDWVLSTSVDVTRGTPAVDAHGQTVAAKPLTNGQAFIRKASGKYQKFPYPLDDVSAYLQFDNERVTVHYLTGKGSGNSQFRISGHIAPPDNDAAVALTLTGTDVPVDDRLRSALKGNELEAFDALFNKPAHDALAAAGMAPDQAYIDKVKQQLHAANQQLAELQQRPMPEGGDPEAERQRARLRGDITRLERRIAAGPFELGGIVDLDLRIDRPLGPKKPTATTGRITLQRVGVMYENFPYPLWVTGGVLNWTEEGIEALAGGSGAGDGLPIIAAGGGTGTISGELAFPKIDGKRKVRPNLAITIRDDEFNDLVYAAIPLSKSEEARLGDAALKWPGGAMSGAATLVQGIGLQGACDYQGLINTGDDGKIGFDFTVSLASGAAKPTRQLADAIGARGEPWPHGLALDDVHGSLRVTRDLVSWDGIKGRSGESTVKTSGSIALRGEDRANVSIHFGHIPVHASVLNLLKPEHAPKAQELWTHLQPQGTFDARFAYQEIGDKPSTKVATVQPHEVTALMDARRLAFNRTDGQLIFDESGVGFDRLMLKISDGEGVDHGELTLDGHAGGELTGTWTNGRFESPAIVEGLAQFASVEQADDYRSYDPAGRFDADFHIKRGGGERSGGRDDYEIAMRPHSLDCTIRGTRIATNVREGTVTLKPGAITIDQLDGSLGGGAGEFALDGLVQHDGPLEADLHIAFAGLVRSDQFEAFLPDVAREAFEAIEFNDGGPTTNVDLDLNLKRVHAVEAGAQDSATSDVSQDALDDQQWQVSVRGSAQTRGAALTAGLEFSDIDGVFDLTIEHGPGVTPVLEIMARADRATVLRQHLRNIEAPIRLVDASNVTAAPPGRPVTWAPGHLATAAPDSDGDQVADPGLAGSVIRIDSLRADAGAGTVTAQAWAGVGDNRNYEATIELIGVPLEGFSNPPAPHTSQSIRAADQQGDRDGDSAPLALAASADQRGEDVPQGEMYASMSLSGIREQPQSRRGRGVVRVLRGDMASIPLGLQLIQMVQLTLPFGGSLDFADADMYLVGDRIFFERIVFESSMGGNAMLQLFGTGEMNFDTLELNTRFRSRSGVAGLRDIVGVVSDRLYEIEVTGTLGDPQARIVPLPGTAD